MNTDETGKISEATVQERTLIIPVAGAEMHYVVPGTIVHVHASGALQQFHGARNNVIRDDSDKLRLVAALAKAHYSKNRREITVQYPSLRKMPELGTIVSNIHSAIAEEVNTCITSRSWDFTQGTCEFRTRFAELAFVEASGADKVTTVSRSLLKVAEEVKSLNDRTGNLPVRGFF